MGEGWRIPTVEEWNELMDEANCTWTWTTLNEVNGYKVQSKIEGFNEKWIFIPAAGFWSYSYLDSVGSEGRYWSSSLEQRLPHYAYSLYINSEGAYENYSYRSNGFPIRPVTE